MRVANTEKVKAIFERGLQAFREEAKAHREHGRLTKAAMVEEFCDAAAHYVFLLENGIRAARQSFKAYAEKRYG
jgi:hypothetical protein